MLIHSSNERLKTSLVKYISMAVKGKKLTFFSVARKRITFDTIKKHFSREKELGILRESIDIKSI